ncbi:hypothetical protein CHH91_04700 [Virgibacillus sp. 7505]|uniref:hypothetical protein n=1 Tax=Virgibacillus sp. 7505 TaxID=2022548 RepID=UPI000BA6CB3F|nr:hypothetical protein [Virgibacillus sp. 7505]PAE17308.1 hypothetical protein CHH91_04700 [Virgibacillus sp. 7505]
MARPIRIELYGEFVKARMDVEVDTLKSFVFSEDDNDDVKLPKLTPEHPSFSKSRKMKLILLSISTKRI